MSATEKGSVRTAVTRSMTVMAAVRRVTVRPRVTSLPIMTLKYKAKVMMARRASMTQRAWAKLRTARSGGARGPFRMMLMATAVSTEVEKTKMYVAWRKRVASNAITLWTMPHTSYGSISRPVTERRRVPTIVKKEVPLESATRSAGGDEGRQGERRFMVVAGEAVLTTP
jgi:hypothetical protein